MAISCREPATGRSTRRAKLGTTHDMRRMYLFVAFVLATVTGYAQTLRPIPSITHVVIISVDGMRPDLMLRANMPNVRKLMAEGSYSMWAQTTEVSITLPSHTSMLTGVTPEVHGMTFNDDGPEEAVHPKVSSVFDIAHTAGLTTAMATGKSKLALIALPSSLDWNAAPKRGKGASDAQVANLAAGILVEHKPDLLFVHFGDNDGKGHSIGWGSPEQMKVLDRVDVCIGKVMDARHEAGLDDSTIIILSADHGGRQKWHGANDPRARHIPWIISGPGLHKDLDLDLVREKQIRTEDTFATACALLGLTVDHPIVGTPVTEAFVERPASTSAPAQSTKP